MNGTDDPVPGKDANAPPSGAPLAELLGAVEAKLGAGAVRPAPSGRAEGTGLAGRSVIF